MSAVQTSLVPLPFPRLVSSTIRARESTQVQFYWNAL